MNDQRSGEEGVAARLVGATEVIAAIVATLEPERYSGADARILVDLFARIERLGAAGKALAARRVAETEAWRSSGARSAADWLGRTTGTTAGQAAQMLSTSQQLKDHPEIDAAVRSGALSSTQAAEIASAAKDAPEEATRLIGRAQSDSVQGLRQDCQAVKAAATGEDPAVRRRRIHASRYLRSWVDGDGAGRLDARMTPEDLARLRASLSPFEHAEFEAARRQGRTEPYQAYALDALLSAVHAAGYGVDADGGDGGPSGSGDRKSGGGEGASPSSAGDASGPGHEGEDPSSNGAGAPGGYGGDREGAAGNRTSGRADDDDGADAQPTATAGGAAGGAGAPGNGAGSRGAYGYDGEGGGGGATGGGDPTANGHPIDVTAHEVRPRPPEPSVEVVRPVPRSPALVIVRIDHAALIRAATQAGECCEIDGVGPVPVEVVRAMMADAFLAAVLTNGIDIRRVAHLGRSVTAAQRTALYVRDPECVVPGCHVRTRLEIDHVQGWAATRVTRLDDLARLCHYHHGRKTYDGWILRGPPGQWTFSPPDQNDARPDRPP